MKSFRIYLLSFFLITLFGTSLDAEDINNNTSTNGCGYIDLFNMPTTMKEQQHAVFLYQINGENVFPSKRYKIPTGKHTIKIQEQIIDSFKMKYERRIPKYRTKLFTLEIKANKAYVIAAQYLKLRDRTDPRRDDYWKPIIKEQKNITCSL